MIDMLALFAVIYSCFYLIVSILIAIGEYRFRRQKLPDTLPTVSVVVCARNEEKSIRRCLESLTKLDYPEDKLEIIVVDDESEDSTRSIIREYAARNAFITALSTENEPRNLPAKQRPLNQGIRESSGEIILITDADCAVKPGWVKGHVAAYCDKKVGIAGGITVIPGTYGSIFARLQASELVTKLAVVMGSAGLGFPVTFMGNNISFRRDAYDATGGFSKIKPHIVEDMALMNAVIKQTNYHLGWAGSTEGVVETQPEESLSSLVNQRLRWITELGDFARIGKIFMGIEICMACVCILSLVLSWWISIIPAVTFLSWLLGYGIILLMTPGSKFSNVALIPGMLVFQAVYGSILLKKSITGNMEVVWKGRVFNG
ncbi:MAG: glycosyltransferase [Candidatus Latescibacteria bacterium]|nr:glycosyltransferase [Candidatus Latescibacterota bacterium]